jgi:hypothetical protein
MTKSETVVQDIPGGMNDPLEKFLSSKLYKKMSPSTWLSHDRDYQIMIFGRDQNMEYRVFKKTENNNYRQVTSGEGLVSLEQFITNL